MTHWCLAVKIQYNHEWTRINTNENRRCDAFLPTQSSSPNRDCKAGHPKSLNRRAIRVYSCPFVVSHCMDTAKAGVNEDRIRQPPENEVYNPIPTRRKHTTSKHGL